MTNKFTSKLGFTLIEMTIVLILVGVLTASLAPLLLRQHNNAMEERDRVALESAKTALINYAISFGGIPDPATINGIPNAMSAVSAFGVNNWGAFGDATTNPFRLDVNNNLQSGFINDCATNNQCDSTLPRTTGQVIPLDKGNKVVFCQAVNAQMSAGAISPSICQDFNDRTVAGTTTVCSTPSPAAFVLYSTGNDRTANQGNALGNRIYENDKRGINNSPGDSHYDDQVMSYPMSLLARDCRDKMGVAPEVMSCPAGQKYVASVTNNIPASIASSVSYSIGADSWAVVANSTAPVKKCYSRSAPLAVSGVGGTSLVGALDLNNDGWVDILFSWIGGVFTVTSQ